MGKLGKYLTMGTQLTLLIFIAIYAGGYLDRYMGNKTPYITIILVFLGLAGSLYQIYRSVMKDQA